MEIFLLAVFGALAVWYFVFRDNKPKNQSKVTEAPYKLETPAPAPQEATAAPAWHTAPPEGTQPLPFPNPLDVNNDGKVNMEDVKEVVKKAKSRVKKDTKVAADKSKAKSKVAPKKPAKTKKA